MTCQREVEVLDQVEAGHTVLQGHERHDDLHVLVQVVVEDEAVLDKGGLKRVIAVLGGDGLDDVLEVLVRVSIAGVDAAVFVVEVDGGVAEQGQAHG